MLLNVPYSYLDGQIDFQQRQHRTKCVPIPVQQRNVKRLDEVREATKTPRVLQAGLHEPVAIPIVRRHWKL